MQRPRSDKLEAAQSLQILHETLRRFMAVVVASAFWKYLMFIFSMQTSSGHGKERCRRTSYLARGPSVTWFSFKWWALEGLVGERQGIAQKGVRVIWAEKLQLK